MAAARRRAAERVRAQEEKRLEALELGVASVMATVGVLAGLREQVVRQEEALRGHVGDLVDLGKTAEEIAELAEVDVSVIRSVRRPKARAGAASEARAGVGRVPEEQP